MKVTIYTDGAARGNPDVTGRIRNSPAVYRSERDIA